MGCSCDSTKYLQRGHVKSVALISSPQFLHFMGTLLLLRRRAEERLWSETTRVLEGRDMSKWKAKGERETEPGRESPRASIYPKRSGLRKKSKTRNYCPGHRILHSENQDRRWFCGEEGFIKLLQFREKGNYREAGFWFHFIESLNKISQSFNSALTDYEGVFP